MRAAATAVPAVTRRAFARRGFGETGIVTDWPEIVGPALAAQTAPERLVFPRKARTGGTLHVRVGGAFATELQHLEPLVIERVNRYFGYAAVARLSLAQGPIRPAQKPRRRPVQPLSEDQRREIDRRVSDIADETLRDSLKKLGTAVLANRERPTE